jgi:hypothetical protein
MELTFLIWTKNLNDKCPFVDQFREAKSKKEIVGNWIRRKNFWI